VLRSVDERRAAAQERESMVSSWSVRSGRECAAWVGVWVVCVCCAGWM